MHTKNKEDDIPTRIDQIFEGILIWEMNDYEG